MIDAHGHVCCVQARRFSYRTSAHLKRSTRLHFPQNSRGTCHSRTSRDRASERAIDTTSARRHLTSCLDNAPTRQEFDYNIEFNHKTRLPSVFQVDFRNEETTLTEAQWMGAFGSPGATGKQW